MVDVGASIVSATKVIALEQHPSAGKEFNLD
jgi:hypothetical protein